VNLVRVRVAFGDIARRVSDAVVRQTGHAMEQHAQQFSNMAHVVERNINALIERHERDEANATSAERISGIITDFTGSMRFVYLHLALFSLWIVWNLGWLGLPEFDESFVVLAMVASVEAIFLSTFVLISQNRMTAQADKRADLDLQICLLTEHEVTRLVSLVTQIAREMNIEQATDPELEELARDVQPERVLDAIDQHAGRA